MTADEAKNLRVGESVVFIVEPAMDEIFEMKVVRVELNEFSDPTSTIMITANSKVLSARVYAPSEIHRTYADAVQKMIEIQQAKADQALTKKNHMLAKLAALRGGRNNV